MISLQVNKDGYSKGYVCFLKQHQNFIYDCGINFLNNCLGELMSLCDSTTANIIKSAFAEFRFPPRIHYTGYRVMSKGRDENHRDKEDKYKSNILLQGGLANWAFTPFPLAIIRFRSLRLQYWECSYVNGEP